MPDFEMTQAQYNKFLSNERKDAKNAQRRYAKNRAESEVISANRDHYDALLQEYMNDGTYASL